LLEFWLVRHGETDWNRERRVQGWTDIPLNANGRVQAKALSRQLEGIPFRVLLTSDLTRARSTAEILRERLNTPICVTSELRERNFGEAEGLPSEIAIRRFPNGAPNRETDLQVRQRLLRIIQHARDEIGCGRVLCVSHGGMIREWLSYIGHEAGPLENTSLTRIRYQDAHWQVVCVNWHRHLEGIQDAHPLERSHRA
jgi:probable phosphoglycerate mutase